MMLLAVTALFIRLTQGPVLLDALLPRLEAIAGEALAETGGAPAHTVRIGGAQIDLGPAGAPAPGLYATDVVLQGAGGTVIAAMPAMRLGFRPFDALRGEFRLSAISLLQPTLRLPPMETAAPSRAGPAPLPSAETIALWLARAPSLLGSIGRVVLRDAVIEVPMSDGRVHSIEGVSLTLHRNGAGLTAEGTMPMPGGGIAAIRANRDADGALAATLSLSDMPAASLAALHPALAALRGVEGPLGGELRLHVSPTGGIETARLSAALGPGRLHGPSLDRSLPFDALEIAAAFDIETGQVALDRLAIRTPFGHLTASGTVEAAMQAGTAPLTTLALSLDSALLPLGVPEGGAVPALARFDGGTLVARLDGESGRIDLAELFLRRGAMTLSASGSLQMSPNGGSTVRLSGLIRDLSVAELKRLWPPQLGPDALAWAKTHLDRGRVEEATLDLAGPLADPAFALNFAFRDAVARPLPALPPLTGSGWGSIGADGLAVMLAEGGVTMPGAAGGRLTLDGSSFHIDAFDVKPIPGRLMLKGTGSIATILTVLDSAPLSLLGAMPVAPAEIGGTAEVKAWLGLPLLKELPRDQVSVKADATLYDVDLPLTRLRPGLRLTAEALTLQSDARGLRLQGSASAGGMALDIDWREAFEPGPGVPATQLALTGALDLERLGVDPSVPGLALDTALPIALQMTRDGAPGVGFSFDADLRRAALDLAPLGWSKPRGGTARLRGSGRWTPGGTRLDRLSLDAGALTLRGSLTADAAGELRQATIDTLRIGDRTEIGAEITRGEAGLEGRIRGAKLDARGLADVASAESFTGIALSLSGEAPARNPGEAARLRFEIDRIQIEAGRVLHHAVGQWNRDASGMVDVSLAGSLNGVAPLTVDVMRQADGTGGLTLRSSDAGGLLRAAGVFRTGIGGSLRGEARLLPMADGTTRLVGHANIDEIVVGEDGALDRMLESADLDAALTQLEREGIRFDRVHAPFEWHGDQLKVIEAVATGSTVGLILSGNYDATADRLAMQGVFTPLYGLNSLIGQVPLIGPLLTGGEGQGLIAFNFSLTGPASAPVVSVNPFSALLPGILREIIQPNLSPE
jgi:hypothetical protein